MATFNTPTGGAAGSSSGRQFLQSRTAIISEVDPLHSSASHAFDPHTGSNHAPLSPLTRILSYFHLKRRGKKDQSITITNPARTYAGTAKSRPLESETRPLCCLQQTSRHHLAETARHDLVWLRNQLASPDTRAGAYCSSDDDANSDYSELISEGESDAEDAHHCVILAAYDPDLDQPVFLCATCDTGAALNIISYAKARIVAPDDVSDGFSNVGTRVVDTLGGSVTVHGPIWITFCLQNEGSRRTRYRAAFYVPPESYGESCFDALLGIKISQRSRLVDIRCHSTVEVEARR
jgi:hypothetical protein